MSLSMLLSASPMSSLSAADVYTSLFDSHIVEVLTLFLALLLVHVFQPLFLVAWRVMFPMDSVPIKCQKTMDEDVADDLACDDDSLSTSADSSAISDCSEDEDVVSIAPVPSPRPKPESQLSKFQKTPVSSLQKPLRFSKLGALLEVSASLEQDACEEAVEAAPTGLQREVTLAYRMSQIFREDALVFRDSRKAFQHALEELEAEQMTGYSSQESPKKLVFRRTHEAIRLELDEMDKSRG